MQGKTIDDMITSIAKERVDKFSTLAISEMRASFDNIFSELVRLRKYKNGDMLDENQVAEYLGVSVSTLQAWRNQKAELPYIKIKNKIVRYKFDDVLKFLESGYVRVTRDGKVL